MHGYGYACFLLLASCTASVGSSDSGPQDILQIDSGPADVGAQDSGADLGPPDTGQDAGPNAGPDAGPTDTGPTDVGPPDLGPEDLGPPDLGPADMGPPDAGPPAPLSVFVFSRTQGFRHGSIGRGIQALTDIAAAEGWTLEATEDLGRVTPAVLANVDVFVALNTTGDFLGAAEQDTLQTWYRAGGGFVGVHSAADAEYEWPWYQELVGAWFQRHPAIQNATLNVEDRTHPATQHLGTQWMRRDEWYDFRRNPRPNVQVLITIDETSYSGGMMGADHPMTWAREFDGGRTFYTAFGHTADTYDEPDFRTMIREAMLWTAGR